MPASAILDLDDPQIWIILPLPHEIVFCFGLGDGRIAEQPDPSPFMLAAAQTGGRRPVKLDRAVEQVDAEEYGAGGIVAMTNDRNGYVLGIAAAQIRPDPELTFDTHRPWLMRVPPDQRNPN